VGPESSTVGSDRADRDLGYNSRRHCGDDGQMQPVNRYSRTAYVAPLPERRHLPAVRPISGEIVGPALDVVRQGSAGGHARSDDDAVGTAKATLLVSAAYGVAALLITLGLLALAWIFRWLGGSWPAYAYGGLLIWGVVVVVVLLLNRRQGLHHSPSGIAHHEISARERIARHAIDTHADLLLERWRLDQERNQ